MVKIEQRLSELGIELPKLSKSLYTFVPAVQSGSLLFLSGQIPIDANGELIVGKVGKDVTFEEACEAAHRIALSLLANMKQQLGDLDRVKRIVKLTGFVGCMEDFIQVPDVINVTSNVMVNVFGDKGTHARSALGLNVLPFNVPVEVEAIVEIESSSTPSV